MVTGLGSNNVDKCKRVADDLNIRSTEDNRNEIVYNCSICLEPLVNKNEDRSPVTLRCEHQFHLDCIGSAFNAKNKMQCPNCRNIEPGEWRYPIDRPTPGFNPVRPTPDFNPVGRTAEREVTPLGFGVELCPFEGLNHLNPFRGPNLCPYFDYCLTIAHYSAISRVSGIPNFNSDLTTGSGIFHNPYGLYVDPVFHRSNPLWFIPLFPLPTNPRFFRSVYNPEVIIARHYFTHQSSDYSRSSSLVNNSLGGISAANASVVSSYQASSSVANAPMFPPYSGGSSAATVPVVTPYQGGSGGDNDRGDGSGGVHEEHDCGPS